MARRISPTRFTSSLEVQAEAPLDAREVVDSLTDLTDVASFPYSYEGMQVYVKSEKKVYTLIGSDSTDINNWKVSGDGGANEYTAGQGIRINNGTIDTPLLDKDFVYGTKTETVVSSGDVYNKVGEFSIELIGMTGDQYVQIYALSKTPKWTETPLNGDANTNENVWPTILYLKDGDNYVSFSDIPGWYYSAFNFTWATPVTTPGGNTAAGYARVLTEPYVNGMDASTISLRDPGKYAGVQEIYTKSTGQTTQEITVDNNVHNVSGIVYDDLELDKLFDRVDGIEDGTANIKHTITESQIDEIFSRVYGEGAVTQEHYSVGEEVLIGTWKESGVTYDLYRKVIDFGPVPSSTLREVSHGITNYHRFVSIRAITYGGTDVFEMPYAHPEATYAVGVFVRTANNTVVLTTGTARNGYNAMAIIEFTRAREVSGA